MIFCPAPVRISDFHTVNLATALARPASVAPQPIADLLLLEGYERLLRPKTFPHKDKRLNADDLAFGGVALLGLSEALPLGLRWQRKRTLWDRGAKWKRLKRSGPLPPSKIMLLSGSIEAAVAEGYLGKELRKGKIAPY